MSDWRTSQLQRDVREKREELARLDRAITTLETMLSEAISFEAEFGERIATIEQRIGEVGNGYDLRFGLVRPGQGEPGEHTRLMEQRTVIEGERDRLIAERRILATDAAGKDRSWSPLRVLDVQRRLNHVRIVRSVAAAELAALEERLSAGERLATGQAAPDFVEHRERVEALRAGA